MSLPDIYGERAPSAQSAAPHRVMYAPNAAYSIGGGATGTGALIGGLDGLAARIHLMTERLQYEDSFQTLDFESFTWKKY